MNWQEQGLRADGKMYHQVLIGCGLPKENLEIVGWLVQGHKDKLGGPSRQQHPKMEEQGPRNETC